jgi:hypothetical protein
MKTRILISILTTTAALVANGESRRLVLADESRAKVHYYDSSDPAKCFSIPVEKPVWDLKRVGDGKYRIVCRKGFMVVDLNQRKVVDTFRHPALDEVTAICDLPDGGFVASVNPRSGELKGKAILVMRFSKDRKLVSIHAFRGIFYGRTLTRLDNGELLLAQDQGFTRGRLPEGEGDGIILQHFKQPAGRNLFDVELARDGSGYWAGTGYGAQLVRVAKDGSVVSAWQAPPTNGLKNVFYAQPQEMPNGHVYIANWTGHGAQDSRKGWQVIEFDEKGKVVWSLYDPATYGSVSGVIVLDAPVVAH